MKKLSSYQKLKAENEKLRSDLRELAAHPSSERSILIKMCEIYQQKFEDMVWHGNKNDGSKVFIFNQDQINLTIKDNTVTDIKIL